MNSRLYLGEVMHARLSPRRHRFRYPYYFYVFDLDELETLDQELPGFGYNRRARVSLWDQDYLQGAGSIRQRLEALLARHGHAHEFARIELVTMARLWHIAFNPVSFHYCYQADGNLACVVAEVNNTFGERHVYILDEPLTPPGHFPVRYRHAKEFHVSPFNNRAGHYEFSLPRLDTQPDIGITLMRDGQRVIIARLSGRVQPLTAETLRRLVRRYPLTAALTVPRIAWQALRLWGQRRLPVFHKPAPNSPRTLAAAPPGPLDRLGRRAWFAFCRRLRSGRLDWREPDGARTTFGDPAAPAREVRVRDNAFYTRLLFDGDIGFGDGYLEGEWETDELTALLKLFTDNAEILESPNAAARGILRIGNQIRHLLRPNTRQGSRRNIHAHYDLGNDFFQTFLDETMLYSCALHAPDDPDLATAQRRKMSVLIRRARLTAQDHVLEIGCGWGGFALEAVRQTGCRVTGLTVSPAQYDLARARVAAAGLTDRIDIQLRDYRDCQGQFDKIISIEMLEAVGHRYLGRFFAACDRLLKPDGLVVLQVITIPDQRYNAYRRRGDWIQKQIFPGGHLPSLTAMCRAMTRHSNLIVEELENIGPHYARTLCAWRTRFDAAHDRLDALGYDERFRRAWRYYFAYCEAGFAARYLNNLHLVLTRPRNHRLPC
ncbi:MAG: DUF1365 family protein [Candidatus Marinimicrobia bacterium]|nr:DUF1365 family protein [Candidatus Neomarinimicrobiota bacterium]